MTKLEEELELTLELWVLKVLEELMKQLRVAGF